MDKLAVEAFLYSADFGEDYYLLASSSSESESECCCCSDSDTSIDKSKPKRQKVEGFAEITVPCFDDNDFKSNFRVSKATCNKVTELIYDDFCSEHKGGWERITPVKATYILLWYLGNKETFKQISDRFRITQSCVHNIVKVGCRNLSSKLPYFVKWPEEKQIEDEVEAFHELSRIPGMFGAIGVTHIKILRPKEDYDKYLNKRNYYSIAMQGVVGSNKNFMHICMCEGSLENYEILDKSSLSSKLDGNITGNYFLVGNNTYPTIKGLVTPFSNKENNLTVEQMEFNLSLSRAYGVAFEAFGKLKARFQRLTHLENKEVPFILKCIEAACVVHNICVENDDDCEVFHRDEGIFNCEFEFEGEDSEKRTQVFESFAETYSDDDEGIHE